MAVATSPNPCLDSAAAALLPTLAREGVTWTGGIGRRPLRVHLAVANPHDRPTAPMRAAIEMADFGVFRPWSPLTRIAVPPIPPGGRLVMTGTADGDEQRRRIQAASAAIDLFAGSRPGSEQRPIGLARLLERQLRLVRLMFGRAMDAPEAGLGCAMAALPTHFVGNLNVFLRPGRAVERHLSRSAGARPGQLNSSVFLVGNGEPDTYTFDIRACTPGWDVHLAPVEPGVPIGLSEAAVFLLMRVPEGAESGRIEISVHQRSSDTTGLVEFELETVRVGAKGYFQG